MAKQVDKLHLVYGYIICGIVLISILICWILSYTGKISEKAFDNFAFASSIVSIVLAVVSIVHAIYSNSGVVNSVGVLKETEESIRQQVENLKGIENDIITKVEEGDQGISDQISSTNKMMETLISQNNGSNKKNNSLSAEKLFDLETNSPVGNVCLYICLKSYKTKKTWKLDMLGEKYTYYLWGYIYALKTVRTSGFNCNVNIDTKEVNNCMFSESVSKKISTDELKTVIAQSKSAEKMQSLIEKIDMYFSEN